MLVSSIVLMQSAPLWAQDTETLFQQAKTAYENNKCEEMLAPSLEYLSRSSLDAEGIAKHDGVIATVLWCVGRIKEQERSRIILANSLVNRDLTAVVKQLQGITSPAQIQPE